MAAFLNDTFDEASDTELSVHTPNTGGAYSKHAGFAASIDIIGGTGYAKGRSASTSIYVNSATPPSADYTVELITDRAAGSSTFQGVLGRASSTVSTWYMLYYDNTNWVLNKSVSGTSTDLGTYASAFTAGTPQTIMLSMVGTAIKAFINGVERISVTDSAITAAGLVAVRGREDARLLSLTADTPGGGGGSSIAAISSYYRMMRNA